VVGYATGSAFATRYTAAVVPLLLLVSAVGVTLVPARARAVLLAVVAVTGLGGGLRVTFEQRTQAAELAEVLAAEAAPGDVVALCPDQLGPALSRLLPAGIDVITYPSATGPELVDWEDYAERMDAGKPAAFAELADERAGAGTVWYAWAGRYRSLDRHCEELKDAFEDRRPGWVPRVESGAQFEHAALEQYPAAP